MRWATGPIALLLLLALAPPSHAGTQDYAVVALHAEAHAEKGGDPCVWDGSSCSDFATEWPAFSAADLYLIVARGEAGPGIASLSCGIEYGSNLSCFSFSFCGSGLQEPSDGGNGLWPASGGGNLMHWDPVTDCQTAAVGGDGVHALAGSFYVYAYGPDLFRVIENPNPAGSPEFRVGDCAGQVTALSWPEAAGAVGFGGITGYSPCGVVPARDATWGRVKAQY
jgi:hypothetical protein